MNFAASSGAIGDAANWMEANQRYLMGALAVVRGYLEQRGARSDKDAGPDAVSSMPPDASLAMPIPPAIDVITATFGLSAFERDVLLLCAGVELDTSFAASCAAAQGDPKQSHPTFALALSVLPGAHWSALSPTAPLRRFRLIEVGAGNTLTGSPLRIDERVLHHIAGEPHLDERLAGLVDPAPTAPVALVPTHRAIASRIAAVWRRASSWDSAPIVQLSGPDGDGKRAVAGAACAEIGASLYALPAQLIGGLEELTLARLLTREAMLSGSALLLDCDDLDGSDVARSALVSRLLDRIAGPLIVTSRDRGRVARRPAVLLEVAKPTLAEQRALWAVALSDIDLRPKPSPSATPHAGAPAAAKTIELLVSQFDMGAAAIDAACFAALAEPEADPGRALWDACRSHARPPTRRSRPAD